MSYQASAPRSAPMVETIWTNLDHLYNDLEKKLFNPIGYIPVVGTLSGLVRASYGTLQGTVASIGLVVEPILGALSSNRADSIRHYDAMGACLEHQIHGLLNVTRGTVELVPFLPWLVCVPLDLAGGIYSYRSNLPNCQAVTIKRESDLYK